MRRVEWIILPALVLAAVSCASRSTPVRQPAAAAAILETREGLASYYGPGFHGKRTASGSPFDMNAMVAAHPTYPFGTIVRVTNLANGRSATVRILDRGPFRGNGVIIDVSRGAADKLGFIREGRTRVRLEVLRWGS
jgi:rare lipoprotein A